MTKTIGVSNKTHKKIKRDATDEEMTIRDFVEDKLGGLIIMGLLFVGGIGLASAEEVTVNVPFESWNIETSMFTGERLDNGTMVYVFEYRWIGTLEQIAQAWQDMIPEDPDEIESITIPDTETIIIPPIEEDMEVRPTGEELLDRLKESVDERRTEIEAEQEQLIGKLAECRTGLGAYGAYQEQEAIQDYANKTRWDFAIRDNLSKDNSVKKILLAIEECRIMKRYADMNLVGAFELNRYLADVAGLDYLGRTAEHALAKDVTDQSDSMVETDPVTPKDRADEVEEMEELRDRLIDERKFEDPNKDHDGINRGNQPLGIRCQVQGQPHEIGGYSPEVCPLDDYNKHILDNPPKTYKDYLDVQCDYFLNTYIHKLGTDDFPVWLNHCVPKVVREG